VPNKTKAYDKNSIRQLKGLEAVRERPGMYLGDPSSGDALHRLIWEVVDNSVDEHLAGHCTKIWVELMPDGWASVADNGRGVPVGPHPTEGIDTLELVMTSLHAGGKFDADSYDRSAGLHGVGVSAVNAVSAECAVFVFREGKRWHQRYVRGKPITAVTHDDVAKHTGTEVHWKRDLQIFSGVTEYDRKVVAQRLQELAFLNPGLTLLLVDTREAKPWRAEYCYARGLPQFIEELTKRRKALTPILAFSDHLGEIAMVWTDSSEEDVRCYANNTFNADGGTHLTGFRNGLTRVVAEYAKEHGLLKGLSEGLSGADVREGLTAIVSIKMGGLAFSSQTKEKLVTPKARAVIEDLFKDQVEFYLQKNPGVAKKIAERAVLNAKAREAARRAREQVHRKNLMDTLSLPGKLADCSSKRPHECELFIVEGDSAGGSAKGARDRRFQAILPLRGKVLNTERAPIEAILENEELGTLLTALGCGLESAGTFDVKRLRYHKIVLLTDADVDGAHIRTLLLTFFYRCLPRLIHEGFIYIGQPPLYGARLHGARNEYYFSTEKHYREFYDTLEPGQRKRLRVTRYKGLGEMNPEELWATTLDPAARVLCPVTVRDALVAEAAFGLLMGADVDQRRHWIEDNGEFAANLDF